MPQYLISQSDEQVMVRNFEGVISTYTQPAGYRGHDVARCRYCHEAISAGSQQDVGAALRVDRPVVWPEAHASAHRHDCDMVPDSYELQGVQSLAAVGGA
jgi:lysine 2,3-aminomutase